MAETRYMIAGAVATGLLDGVMEGVFESNPGYWMNKFPFIGTVNPLPPVDDWIVLAVPAAAYAYGRFGKNEAAKNFGLGGLLYAGAMFIHQIIIRSVRMTRR